MPNPLQLFDALAGFLQVHHENVPAYFESGFRQDLIFFDAFEAGYRDLLHFKSRSRCEIKNGRVSSPANNWERGDTDRDPRKSDKFGYLHAVLENRCDSVS